MTKKVDTLVEFGRWISVEEAIPDYTMQLVLYTTERGVQGLAQYFKGEGFMDPFDGPVSDVTYWYGFPQPPKQDLPEPGAPKRSTINLSTDGDRVSRAATIYADKGGGGYIQEYLICVDEKDTGIVMVVELANKDADLDRYFLVDQQRYPRLGDALKAMGWEVTV